MANISITATRDPADGKLKGIVSDAYYHGDTVNFTGSFGANTNYKAFSKPIIESATVGTTPANASNYVFDEPLGYLPTVVNDSERGKVLRTTQDNDHYDSIIKHHLPTSIPENTWVYWSFCQKSNLRLAGNPYPYYFQRKLGRLNYTDTILDGQHPEIKYHVNSYAGGQYVDENRLFNACDGGFSIYGAAQSTTTCDNTWHMAEIIVFTGTQGVADGRIIVRGRRGNINTILRDVKNTMVYSDSQRFNHLLHQEYYGNFGVTADEGTKPDLIELFTDSSTIIIGDERIDLCDTASSETCTFRENLQWTSWNGNISAKLSLAGLSEGVHTLKKRVITGYDSNGWDIVSSATDIEVIK